MSNERNAKRFKQYIILTICILLLIVSFSLLFRAFLPDEYSAQKKEDIALLSAMEYNSIFCSMYSIDNFSQDDFATYRGLNTLMLDTPLENTSDVNRYLSAAFTSGNAIENIYLGLDPARIHHSSLEINYIQNQAITKDIISHATNHPEVIFEVLLPAPSLSYWLSESAEDTEEILQSYQALINSLDPYSNIIVYFMGHEHWLIANPANYCDDLTTNNLISQKIMLFTFCDHDYQITSGNSDILFNRLREILTKECTSPTPYPDLSSWDIVFFGDSIIGNYTGSFSVPGVVSGLSNARTYNCAKGGIPACVYFPSSVDWFIAQDPSLVTLGNPFQSSLEEYINTNHSSDKLCFVINFGLNDYFAGHPVANPEDSLDISTYTGALRTGILKLQDNYPEATILLMAPTPTTQFERGTQPLSEKGGVLTEYVDAALKIANEMNVLYLNNYTDLGITQDNEETYLADGTHLNENGRFLLAEHIIQKISSK